MQYKKSLKRIFNIITLKQRTQLCSNNILKKFIDIYHMTIYFENVYVFTGRAIRSQSFFKSQRRVRRRRLHINDSTRYVSTFIVPNKSKQFYSLQ